MGEDFNWIEDDEELGELINRFKRLSEHDESVFFDADEYETIIDYFLDRDDLDNALLAINEAKSQYPETSIFLIKEARYLADAEKYYEAIELLGELEVKQEIPIDEFYLSKGEIYSQMNKHDLAIEEFKKSIPYVESPEEVYATIALEYEHLDDISNAILSLQQALRINPKIEGLITEIGYYYDTTARYEEGVDFMHELVDLDPFSMMGWFNLGLFYNALHRYDKAIQAYEYALAIDENFSLINFNIGNSYSSLEQYHKAIEYYELSLKQEDADNMAYYYIGECYENLYDMKKAMMYYNKATEEDYTIADAWAGLGRLFAKQDQLLTAIHYYERAIELQSETFEFVNDLCEVYKLLHQYDKAEMIYNNWLKYNPDDTQAWIKLSEVVFYSKGVAKAIVIIETAVAQITDDAVLWYWLAIYLYRSGKIQQAYFIIEIALKMDVEKSEELLEQLPEITAEPRFIELLSMYKSADRT